MRVATADIQQIHTAQGATRPGSANNFLIVVRKLFNWAPTAGHLPKGHTNPVVGITGFPKRKRRRFLTTAEMPRFIQALEQEDSEFAKHALWLLLLTGLRMRELLKAKWADVDWDAGTLNHLDPKTTAGYAYFQTQQRRDVLTQHANKVLAYVPEQSRIGADHKTVSVEQLLRGNASIQVAEPSPPAVVPGRHFFKREELYELVWTAPVSEVARTLSVSDVGLAKLCRRANIPLPGRGYWARIESGQHISAEPVPASPAGLPALLRIRGKQAPAG